MTGNNANFPDVYIKTSVLMADEII